MGRIVPAVLVLAVGWQGVGGMRAPRPPERPANRSTATTHGREEGLAITARIEVPGAVNVARGYGSVWVSGFGALTRISPATNRIEATIPVRGVEDFSRVAIGEGSVWVSADRGLVYRIDPRTDRVRDTIRVGDVSIGTIAAGAGYLWVANLGPGQATLVRIDPRTGQAVGERIAIASGPDYALFAGGALWVSGDRTIDRIDPQTGTVTRVQSTYGAGSLAFGDASVWSTSWRLDASGNEIDSVIRIDPATAEVAERILVRRANGVAFADGIVWVMAARLRTVLRLDPATGRVIGSPLRIPGRQLISIAAMGMSAWIADYNDQILTRVEVVG